jgi:hypothetical protein
MVPRGVCCSATVRRLAGTVAIIVCNVMHGVELVISAVAEFSIFEILMQQEVVTVGF